MELLSLFIMHLLDPVRILIIFIVYSFFKNKDLDYFVVVSVILCVSITELGFNLQGFSHSTLRTILAFLSSLTITLTIYFWKKKSNIQVKDINPQERQINNLDNQNETLINVENEFITKDVAELKEEKKSITYEYNTNTEALLRQNNTKEVKNKDFSWTVTILSVLLFFSTTFIIFDKFLYKKIKNHKVKSTINLENNAKEVNSLFNKFYDDLTFKMKEIEPWMYIENIEVKYNDGHSGIESRSINYSKD